MVLDIYIGSVCFFYLGYLILLLGIYQKIEEKANRDNIKKFKKIKIDIKASAQLIILSLIPLLNIYIGFLYIFSKEFEKEIKIVVEKYIKDADDNKRR